MDRIESLEINPFIYGQMIFDKCAQTIQQGKDDSPINGAGKSGYPYTKH